MSRVLPVYLVKTVLLMGALIMVLFVIGQEAQAGKNRRTASRTESQQRSDSGGHKKLGPPAKQNTPKLNPTELRTSEDTRGYDREALLDGPAKEAENNDSHAPSAPPLVPCLLAGSPFAALGIGSIIGGLETRQHHEVPQAVDISLFAFGGFSWFGLAPATSLGCLALVGRR